jgi:hypothetical protein
MRFTQARSGSTRRKKMKVCTTADIEGITAATHWDEKVIR